MIFYIAVLEQDNTPHYFQNVENAKQYLLKNVNIDNCVLEPNITNENGELWNKEGISVGYFYKMETED